MANAPILHTQLCEVLRRRLPMGTRSPYLVLGVERHATSGEIRDAYRRRAPLYHPDTAGTRSVEQFLELRDAYDLLRDAEARRIYDQAQAPYSERRHMTTFGASSPARTPLTYSQERHQRVFGRPLSLLLEEPFAIVDWTVDSSDLLASGFIHEGRRREHEDLIFDLLLSPEEAAHGGQVLFSLPLRHRCSACAGSGMVSGFICSTCHGRTEVVHERELEVFVPPHVHDGQRATLPLEVLGVAGGEVTVTVRIQ
jgi:DnaJ-class molecular chaperone